MEMLLTSNIHRSITNNAEESTATDNSHILYIQKKLVEFLFWSPKNYFLLQTTQEIYENELLVRDFETVWPVSVQEGLQY